MPIPVVPVPQVLATKTIALWKLPDVLVLSLKRFKATRAGSRKVGGAVSFPTELDTSPWLSPNADRSDTLYDLYAVVEHSGGSSGGHYTAHCRLAEGRRPWYYFNDGSVSVARKGAKDISQTYAYVLFYERRKPQIERPTRLPSIAVTEEKAGFWDKFSGKKTWDILSGNAVPKPPETLDGPIWGTNSPQKSASERGSEELDGASGDSNCCGPKKPAGRKKPGPPQTNAAGCGCWAKMLGKQAFDADEDEGSGKTRE